MWFSASKVRLYPLKAAALSGTTFSVTVEKGVPYTPVGPRSPPEGMALYAIQVHLKNISSTAQNYRCDQWRLYDTESFAFGPVGLGDLRVQPELIEGYLSSGMEVRGWVTFALPEHRSPARAQFFQGYLSGHPVDFSLA